MKDKLTKEISKYKNFYHRTLYCNKDMLKSLYDMSISNPEEYKNKEVVYKSKSGADIKVDDSYEQMNRRLCFTDRTLFQQLILTRLISALEVSLVENVMDIFMVNKEPFLNQTKFDITEAEILKAQNIEDIQLKIISKTCRDIQSQGIKAISNFYRKSFKINLDSFNVKIGDDIYNYNYILMLHDMRHMIIHNLGNVDAKFKKDYNYNYSTVKFSSQGFNVVFDVLLCFAEFVNKKISFLKTSIIKEIEDDENLEYKLNLEIIDDQMLFVFNDSYTFKIKDQICNFYRIKKSIKKQGSIVDLRIIGDKKIIGKYLGKLKKYEKLGMCQIKQMDAFRDFHESTKK